MPRRYRIIVSDTFEGEPAYARYLRGTISNLGLHVKVRRIHDYRTRSQDPRRTSDDLLREVNTRPGQSIREIASRMYPRQAVASYAERAQAEMKVRSIASRLIRAGQLEKRWDAGLRLYPTEQYRNDAKDGSAPRANAPEQG